ncbi:MAG: thiamine pyrophosphate-dependent enzyme, partial [Firmicutes bacterium]|nr:thiamine pyrophosphate-dependent enzyme [Bacillota bacterium]
MPGVVVDGNDVLAVYTAMRTAVDRALSGDGPTLLEVVTYRLNPHSSDDDDRTYRSREEVAAAQAADALIVFAQYLQDAGVLTASAIEQLRKDVAQDVDAATAYAEAAADPAPEDALSDVFATEGARA